ncbi:MAG: peptidase M75 [Owenweeksia sp.]|nr:peptidase M75 [Owenweeksia sp.]
MYNPTNKTSWAAILAAGIVLSSCNKDDKKEDTTPPDYSELKAQIVTDYATIVHASYEDSYNAAVELQNRINTFVDAPDQLSFDNAKQAWLNAREPYGQTEVYRFYSGPIDNAEGPEGDLNAWPLDESHIDYVENGTGNSENSGNELNIVNNTTDFPTIDKATLRGLNENGSEKNISIGYHAIEFLLWGQDFNTNGPGDRPYTDYVSNGTHENQARRGQYLKVTAEILVEDLKSMVDAWASGASYYNSFVNDDADNSLRKIMTGMGVLSKSELAGERIYVALDNQDQEDEHSCFSDNTHRDIILNATGILNVYTASYSRTDGSNINGASLNELLQQVNPELATELEGLIRQSVDRASAIPVPFDQALTQETVSGDGPIMRTVRSLQEQGDKIAEAAAALGISISTELPE